MALTFKVNGRDLAPYIRTAHDQGLDPANSEYSVPQFAGPPALGEGQGFVGDAVGNREMPFPLILKATDADSLYQLIRDINGDLKKGNVVEFRSGSASNSTFFDLERGRLEMEFEYWLDKAARARCVLRLWVKPYGHTGTTRVIATQSGTHTMVIGATGILGDVSALAQITVRTPSSTGGGGARLIYGMKYPVASGYQHFQQPTGHISSPVASVFGASGRIGSQYLGVTSAGGATYTTPQPVYTQFFRPQDAGRYRLLQPINFQIASPGPSAILSANFTQVGPKNSVATKLIQLQTYVNFMNSWCLYDLGEITVASNVATQYLNVQYAGGSGAVANASHFVRVDDLIILPLDTLAGIITTATYPAGASDWSREYYDVDGISNQIRFRDSTGSVITADLTSNMRGGFPKLPALGTAGYGEMLIYAVKSGGADGGGSDNLGGLTDVVISVRERFAYLR